MTEKQKLFEGEAMQLYKGDCLEEMKKIPDGSVDLVLTDLPYGVTNAEWDTALPLPELWMHWRRILRPFGTVLLFGTQPFISDVISSNRRDFSHIWYWKKDGVTGHMNCHKQPMRNIEECAVFICNKQRKANTGEYPNARKYLQEQKKLSGLTGGQINELLGSHTARHYFTNGSQFSFPSEDAYRRLQTTGLFQLPLKELKSLDKTGGPSDLDYAHATYHPQGVRLREKAIIKKHSPGELYGPKTKRDYYTQEYTGYPVHLLEFSRDSKRVHPTQKPVPLLEYLVRTYTDEGMTVLDCCMGSGSTGVACVNTGRNFIGIEMDDYYFQIASERIAEALR